MTQTETIRTSVFAGVAVVLALITWVVTRPPKPAVSAAQMENQLLYPDFTDALAATSLKIVKFNDETAEPVTFEVAQIGNQWCIPSHDNYPADAKDQLGDVASSLMDLRVLSVALGGDELDDITAEHMKYGVLDPEGEASGVGEGVGVKVTMQDKQKQVLLDLIIGKSVPDRSELRFVRVAGEDAVYVVKVGTDRLSTAFGDWIEKNLLDIDSFDIKLLTISDYHMAEVAVTQGIFQQITTRPVFDGVFEINYDDMGDPKWSLKSEMINQDGQLVDRPLGENEELNVDNLDALKKALDDLKIVNAKPKPEALAKSLAETGNISVDDNSIFSLDDCGFEVKPDPRNPNVASLYSNQGEIWVAMKDGVRYVLRFGDLTGETDSNEQPTQEDGADADIPASGGKHRYVFIMANFDPMMIDAAEIEPLPELPAEDDPMYESVKADRERIERQNQRARDEYDEKVTKATERVKELNHRFAPWYYVIDENVYKQIHLRRTELVREKTADDAAGDSLPPGHPPMDGMGGMGMGMPMGGGGLLGETLGSTLDNLPPVGDAEGDRTGQPGDAFQIDPNGQDPAGQQPGMNQPPPRDDSYLPQDFERLKENAPPAQEP